MADFDYFYSKLTARVFVTETRGGRFMVYIEDPDTGRHLAEKVFKRGADPSGWIGKQLAKVMPKQIAELHQYRNDDPKPEPAYSDDSYRWDLWDDRRYGYDDGWWAS